MLRFGIALLLAPALFGQLATDIFDKAPPPVDEALRARIREFFQNHVEGTAAALRKTERLVAEDSKDFFYTSNKPKYLDFEIQRIDYSENFTKAKAMVVCNMYVMMPGFAGKPLPVPTSSLWKVVDGQWYWYVDPESLNMTPFGKMKGGAKPQPTDASGLPALPDEQTAIRQVMGLVQADKEAVRIDPSKPFTDRITITNKMPGAIALAVTAPKVEGLDIGLEKATIPAGGQGVVIIRYARPKSAKAAVPPSVDTNVRVEQTGQLLPIRITFAK